MTIARSPAAGLAAWPASNRALVAAWLTAYTGHTRAAYAGDVLDFAAWARSAGGRDLLAVTRQVVEQYARDLEAAGRSPATVARRLTALSSMYRRAVDEDLIGRSPVARVRRPRRSDATPRLGLDRDEARAFLDAADRASPRDQLLARLLLLNGLRVSEACESNAADLAVERGHRVLRIRRKGGLTALVPLAPSTAAALDAWLGGRTTGPLLLDAEGRQLDRFDATRIVRRLARRAGIDKRVSPHSLRHAFVTAALDAGVSLRDVQDAAGHRDPRTTRAYDRGRMSLDRHATYRVATFLAD